MSELSILDGLKTMSDAKNAAFMAKLAPTVPAETFLGIRVPNLRKYAAAVSKREDLDDFLSDLPHCYYDENLLHSILLEKAKPFDRCLMLVERFLPYVDNWAVCDTLRPNVFAKNKEALLPHIGHWIRSDRPYTVRFAIDMLMTHYLDEAFDPAYPAMVAAVHSSEYYVQMMQAWYFTTALTKQWDAVIGYLTEGRLDAWVHNKTIRKAIESARITDEKKKYLKKLIR